MEDRYFTAEEIAKLLNVSRAHAYRLIKRGDIASVEFGHAVRVSSEDLMRYLKEKAPRHIAEKAMKALEER